MRILQLIDSLSSGGAERMAVNISNVLATNGDQVSLCASRAGGTLESFVDENVKYVQLNKKHGLDLIAFFKLIKLIRKNKIELIHAHSSSVFWAVAVKVFYPGVKVIWHDHLGKRIEEERFNRIIIIISYLIDGVISVNDSLKAWSQQKLRVKKENIVFINNFPLLRAPYVEVKKVNQTLQIVCLANLRWQKDHITLIKAIHILVSEHKIQNFKVILAGLFTEDECYRSIVHEIEALILNSFFELPGSVSDTASLLYSSDIGVLSSVSEGLPVSLLEYGLAGLPVVITRVGQCAEVVDNGNAGLVVPPSDPDALAEALFDLIQYPERRKLLGIRLKERVEQMYGAEKFLKEYNQLIERV